MIFFGDVIDTFKYRRPLRCRRGNILYKGTEWGCTEILMSVTLVGSYMPVDYHSKLGFPAVDKPTGRFALEPTTHAREKQLQLPSHVTLTPEMYDRDPEEAISGETDPHVFEITIQGGRVVKLGVRMHYDRVRDICLIVKPYRGTIITAWYNYSDDGHETLDESQYAVP